MDKESREARIPNIKLWNQWNGSVILRPYAKMTSVFLSLWEQQMENTKKLLKLKPNYEIAGLVSPSLFGKYIRTELG